MSTSAKLDVTKLPDLHDGYLDGITVSVEKLLSLFCRTVSGESCILRIPDIIRLRADNFSEGNIIFEVNLYSGAECPRELIARLQGYDELNASKSLNKDMERILANNWTLVELTSSYGCDLLALSSSGTNALFVEQV